MNSETKRGVGRPPKLLLDEKKDIVNRYLIHHGNDPTVLSVYGINSKLAQFAKGLDQHYQSVRGYDFSDGETQNYMRQLRQELSAEGKAKLVGCAYTPLDCDFVLTLAKKKKYGELIEFLRERETELLAIYNQAANSLAFYGVLEAKYAASERVLREYKEMNISLAEDLSVTQVSREEEKKELKSLRDENSKLRRTIKQNENQIAVLAGKGLAKGLSITDDIKKLMQKGNDAASEQQDPKRCKVVDFLPALDD